MKKLLVLLILWCPLIIKAQNINNYYINATLNSNGSLLVEEYIDLKEDKNYFERNIYYQDEVLDENSNEIVDDTKLNMASGVELLTIGSAPKIKNYGDAIAGVKEFNKVNVSRSGDTGVYLLRNDMFKDYIRIYKIDDEAYYLKYILKNLAVKNNDVGEIYFEPFKNEENKIKNLRITINLPENNKAYSYSLGVDPKKVKNSNYKIDYQYKNIKENDLIKIRILFDKELLKDSLKVTNSDILPEVLSNRNYTEINFINNILKAVILMLVIINYCLVFIYSSKCLMNKTALRKLYSDLGSRKIGLYGIVSLACIIIFCLFKILGIVLLIMSIIIASYMINKNKDNKRIKYVAIMYVLIMFICCLNLISDNNIVYVVLSIVDLMSLASLNVTGIKLIKK